jgi:DNA processing protein
MSRADENWLALLLAPGLSGARVAEAVRAHGGAGAARRALARAGRRTEPDPDRLATAEAWLGGPAASLVTLDDPRYPARLRRLADAPPALWVEGDPAVLGEPQLAMVGSRNPTATGRDDAHAFARHFARLGLVVTSGLAIGIDTASHEGALAGGGPTVAVLGAGPDVAYPPANAALAGRIIAAGGALVSEYAPGTPPLRAHFPARNRIISGLALGVLVVEAAERSGSLITARLAGEQGREVFAIPGSIHNPLARGCHRLIREGARLVETADDVLGELAPALRDALSQPAPEAGEGPGGTPETRDSEYGKLLENMDFSPCSVDALVARTGLTTAAVSSMLLILELKGEVESRPGGTFVRAVKRV